MCVSVSTKLLQQQQFSISVVSPPAFKFSTVAVIVISVPPSSSICMQISLSRFSLCLSLRYAMQALLTASTDNAQKPIANRVSAIAIIAKTFVPPNQIATAVREYLSLAVLVSGGKEGS